MSQIKTYYKISMNTGFIFVQKDFLVSLFSWGPGGSHTLLQIWLKKPLSVNATVHTVGAQSAEQASTYFDRSIADMFSVVVLKWPSLKTTQGCRSVLIVI